MTDLEKTYQAALIEIAETVTADLDPKTTLAQLAMSLSGMEDAGLLDAEGYIVRTRAFGKPDLAQKALKDIGVVPGMLDQSAIIRGTQGTGDIYVCYYAPTHPTNGDPEFVSWDEETGERLGDSGVWTNATLSEIEQHIAEAILKHEFPPPGRRNLREDEVYPELA